MYRPDNPLVVQNDKTILLEVHHPLFERVRDTLLSFAELIKSPEHIHTYRMTPLSLWNAASSGMKSQDVTEFLRKYSKFPVPDNLLMEVEETMGRFGRLSLEASPHGLILTSKDAFLIRLVKESKATSRYLGTRSGNDWVEVQPGARGFIKQALIRLGYPVLDVAGYAEGEPLDICLRDRALSGSKFELREYQKMAVDSFWMGGGPHGGSGVVVLPCGAGKTIVGIGVMERAKTSTLILCTSLTSARQWTEELLDKTYLTNAEVGEYTGVCKSIRPVTVATYHMITYRPDKQGNFPHFQVFNSRNWGLIIYDEVHLLPAPVFRITAEIQARRRLGLTATLVREDGREEDVFSLIGPKKFDMPWKDLENAGWIASAKCYEIRLEMEDDLRMRYIHADERERFRLAAENQNKLRLVQHLVNKHRGDSILVIGQYLSQLEQISRALNAPMITGKTPAKTRHEIFTRFKKGEIPVLVVSRVGNFSVDLPDTNVLIQVSGTFGSRQEEAQRLGRILRPKKNSAQASFYTLVTKDSKEQLFSSNRQLFLIEQGYKYIIMGEEEAYGTCS